MYTRSANLPNLYSFFLFGARATGKSTLLRHVYPASEEILWVDLLDPNIEKELLKNPMRLYQQIKGLKKLPKMVVIDEVQKVPKILDVVHKLIFEENLVFALTGSSTRKLKRGEANLLAGRALSKQLFPLTYQELEDSFDLNTVLQFGSLPAVFQFASGEEKIEYLYSYCETYIKEEILVEQLVRQIVPFRSFLEVAAQQNGEIVNFAKLAREAQIAPKSAERYYEILEDTLLGFRLPAYSKSIRKRQLKHPKFYFFDSGVARTLAEQITQKIVPQTYTFGKAFEHFIILEAWRLNSYQQAHYNFSYLKTKDGAEIDLVLERGKEVLLIEIKSSDQVNEDNLRHLNSLGSSFLNAKKYLLSLHPGRLIIDNVQVLHWRDGLDEIFR